MNTTTKQITERNNFNLVCSWSSSDPRRIQIADASSGDLIPQGYFHVSDFVAEHEAQDELGAWSKADAELAIRRYFEHTAR